MKNAKWMLPAMLMLLSGVMAAQSLASSTVVAQVPFEFVANNKVIPAGKCLVKSVDMDARVLAINNIDTRASLLAQSSRNEVRTASDRTVMIFNHYGNQYFLSEIRVEGSKDTYKLSESRAEAELRAQNAPASKETLLAS